LNVRVIVEPSELYAEKMHDGGIGELRVSEALTAKGWHCHAAIGRHAAYDILISATAEIKTDAKAASTGNVAIEIACNGRPSGLTTSTADFWVFVIGNDAYLIRTNKLRIIIRELKPIDANGGHNRVVLLPVKTLRQHAKPIPLPNGAQNAIRRP
jgi:hypothetical protein